MKPAPAKSIEPLIAWIREYARERINSRLIDERRMLPPHVVLDFGNRGLLGMQIGKEFGGLGLGYVDAGTVVEELAAIDLTLAVFVGNNGWLGTRPIDRYAKPALREAVLPELASGRGLAAFAITERAAGSNPRAIEATATLGKDGRFRLDGTKIWSGSAGWASAVSLFAQTQDEKGESLGVTGFVVRPGENGVRVGAEALTVGMRGMVQNELHLDDAVVEPGAVLGEVGQGLEVALDAMTFSRIGLAVMSIGGLRRCLGMLHRYAERRRVGTGPLLANPVTRVRIADIGARTLGLTALVHGVGERLDAGEEVPPEVFTACKILGPEFLWQAADWLVQGLGGRGYMENNVAPRLLRDARVFRIFEGPTETLQMFLGTRVMTARGNLAEVLQAAGLDDWTRERCEGAVERLRDGATRGRFEKRSANTGWRSYLAGELFAWALLTSAVRGKRSARVPDEDGSLAAWAESELEGRCARIEAEVDERSRAVSVQIDGLLEQARDFVEQPMPGEDTEIDELLRSR